MGNYSRIQTLEGFVDKTFCVRIFPEMKYLGIDFGLKRVGLAISEGELASPLKVIEVDNLTKLADSIKEEAKRERVDKIVVGVPGGEIGKASKKFIDILRKFGLDVDETDETLSTHDAIHQMIKLDIPKEKRRIQDDFSAAIILQNYLDSKDD